jgi:hypothetical protein
MRHKRGFPARLHRSDIGEMIAVALGREMLDADAHCTVAQMCPNGGAKDYPGASLLELGLPQLAE